MNRPKDINSINTNMRNHGMSTATKLYNQGDTLLSVVVEVRKYRNDGTITYRWEAFLATGEVYTNCVNRILDINTMTLSDPVLVLVDTPLRASTKHNIKNIVETEKKRHYVWSRITGLLLSCAWKVWAASDSEVIVSIVSMPREAGKKSEKIISHIAAIYDGISIE